MVREIGGAGGGQHNPQIKRVSVRSNGAGHANAGVVAAGATQSKPVLTIKDVVSVGRASPSPTKSVR